MRIQRNTKNQLTHHANYIIGHQTRFERYEKDEHMTSLVESKIR